MELDVRENWLNELENFISHWEKESEIIKDSMMDIEGCCKISELFHREGNELLVKRPAGMSDDFFSRLEQLDNKLNSTLAMVCSCSDESSI